MNNSQVARTGSFGRFQIRLKKTLRQTRRRWVLLLFLAAAVTITILFSYVPMNGLQIAFRDFTPKDGITGSEWVGLKHFKRFFSSYNAASIIKNTILLSLYNMLWSFPIPVILALMINQLRSRRLAKAVQNITYMPYFISVVVMVGMLSLFLNSNTGLYGNLMNKLGVENAPNLLADSKWFRTVYIGSGIWQSSGFASVLYLGVLTGIDQQLYEAAEIDGASRFKQILHVDLPCLLPTMTIMFIMQMGNLMNIGFEKVYLMQNSVNVETAEVISTYVYKVGLKGMQYSFATAVSLFNTVINIILLILTNYIAKRTSNTSLF